MGRREQRAQRMRDEARGVDTRTGEVPAYPCPPRLLAPAVVEEWLSTEELDGLSRTDAAIRAWRRWRDARDEYTRERVTDERHLRSQVAELCGSGGRPVWRDELGQPWHSRRRSEQQ